MTITDDYDFGTITAFIDNANCAETDELERIMYNNNSI